MFAASSPPAGALLLGRVGLLTHPGGILPLALVGVARIDVTRSSLKGPGRRFLTFGPHDSAGTAPSRRTSRRGRQTRAQARQLMRYPFVTGPRGWRFPPRELVCCAVASRRWGCHTQTGARRLACYPSHRGHRESAGVARGCCWRGWRCGLWREDRARLHCQRDGRTVQFRCDWRRRSQ
jgi:hypothetical protein